MRECLGFVEYRLVYKSWITFPLLICIVAVKNDCPVYCVSQCQMPQRLFPAVCHGAVSRCSPIEGWPVVPKGIGLRTTWESAELSYRGAEKLPTKSQRCK